MTSTPSAPDPTATANAQATYNKQTAIAQSELNNVNQSTPYGSIAYNQTGTAADGTPQYTATTSLSQPMQNLVNSNISNAQGNSNLEGQLQQSAASTLSQPLNLGPSATSAYLNNLATQTLDPQWATAQNQEQQQLADQGVQPGSEAYDNAMRGFNTSKSDAYNNMYLQDQNSAVNALTQQYNSPLNALTALQSGSQVSQPGVGQTASTAQTGIQSPNYAGLVSQNYQDQLSSSNAAMGGLFGLGGSLLGGLAKNTSLGSIFSDARLKRDVRRIGTGARGLPVYSFRYAWDRARRVGFMAQEVARVAPHAVVRHESGFLMVNYGAI